MNALFVLDYKLFLSCIKTVNLCSRGVSHTTLDSRPQAAQMPKRLYSADPRMVLMPMSPFVINTPTSKVIATLVLLDLEKIKSHRGSKKI